MHASCLLYPNIRMAKVVEMINFEFSRAASQTYDVAFLEIRIISVLYYFVRFSLSLVL